MKRRPTNKQLINAELAARSFNSKAKDIIESHNPEGSVSDLIIEFQCECSDETCQERVPLTPKQYERIHSKSSRFVLAKGHEEPRVERVKINRADFTIVEKPAL